MPRKIPEFGGSSRFAQALNEFGRLIRAGRVTAEAPIEVRRTPNGTHLTLRGGLGTAAGASVGDTWPAVVVDAQIVTGHEDLFLYTIRPAVIPREGNLRDWTTVPPPDGPEFEAENLAEKLELGRSSLNPVPNGMAVFARTVVIPEGGGEPETSKTYFSLAPFTAECQA